MDRFNDAAKATIASLLDNAVKAFEEAKKVDETGDLKQAEEVGRIGHSYLSAANGILNSHYWLHSELIESEAFMKARKLSRKWPR